MTPAKLLKRIRKKIRQFIRDRRRKRYSEEARRVAASCGAGLKVNHPSRFSRFCRFGDNCNFNGMTVLGGGEVSFGNNFHSGENCRIITQNHNFDHGEAIPYDSTYITKKVTIEDNVWLGDSVIVVGNVTIGEGAIVGAGFRRKSSLPTTSHRNPLPMRRWNSHHVTPRLFGVSSSPWKNRQPYIWDFKLTSARAAQPTSV